MNRASTLPYPRPATPPGAVEKTEMQVQEPRETGLTGLRYALRRENDTVVLVPEGDMDFDARDDLARLAVEVAAIPGPLRVDLGAVTFLDSTGVDFIVRLQRHRAEQHEEFTVTRAQPLPARVLKVCGLGGLLADPATP